MTLYKFILACGIIGIVGLPFIIIGTSHGLIEAISINDYEGATKNIVFLLMHCLFFVLSVLITWNRKYLKEYLEPKAS
jgi:formate hydrogenlyase subunit 3/multisubunit Na+/H+ antiporter MnhD subunit